MQSIKFVILLTLLLSSRVCTAQNKVAQVFLTSGDQKHLVERQPPLPFHTRERVQPAYQGRTVTVDASKKYQTIDGFGYCLTDGSARLISSLQMEDRKALLQELFGNKPGQLAIRYLRISIGASDLSDSVYSYDDMPESMTDIQLKHFSIDKANIHLIPLLKEIRTIQPSIKILASPWSAPSWMKSNDATKGGRLLPRYYEAYAHYFVRYLNAMLKAGIPIDAITIQNEPLNPNNNPSMYMSAEAELAFIKNYLGPVFKSNAIKTKIQIYDHNANRPDYPMTILADSVAAGFVDGSAFHLYEGEITALSTVHDSYPDKNIYFTEQYTPSGGSFKGDFLWHTQQLIIGAVRNWSRNVIEWNLAASPELGPHTRGGCTTCLGALTIEKKVISRNPSYYIIAQISGFVPAGSVRIASNPLEQLPNVCFLTPGGQKVCLILNTTEQPQTVTLNDQQQTAAINIPPVSAVTLIW